MTLMRLFLGFVIEFVLFRPRRQALIEMIRQQHLTGLLLNTEAEAMEENCSRIIMKAIVCLSIDCQLLLSGWPRFMLR